MFRPSGVQVKFLPALCHWADLGSWPTACESSLVLCAPKKKRKKVVAHDDHYNAPFVFVASTLCCYLPPIKGLPELHLPCLCLVERPLYQKPQPHANTLYKIWKLACMSLQMDSFLLCTTFFFTTNCLRNERLQMRKENVKRRFDKHMGKDLLKGQPWKSKNASSKNNCHFICVCTFEYLPQQKNRMALCQHENVLFSTAPMFP